MKILVVEDQDLVREAMVRLLKHAGYDSEAVGNGPAALALLKHHPFQLLITDLSMPGMRGDQLIAAVRQFLPSQTILLVTAFVDEYSNCCHAGCGPDALLMKPFSFGELTAAISQVLSKRRLALPDAPPLIVH